MWHSIKISGRSFGFKYSFANLINKQYNESPPAGEYYLNDKENGSIKAKNIMYFQIYLGCILLFRSAEKI